MKLMSIVDGIITESRYYVKDHNKSTSDTNHIFFINALDNEDAMKIARSKVGNDDFYIKKSETKSNNLTTDKKVANWIDQVVDGKIDTNKRYTIEGKELENLLHMVRGI